MRKFLTEVSSARPTLMPNNVKILLDLKKQLFFRSNNYDFYDNILKIKIIIHLKKK